MQVIFLSKVGRNDPCSCGSGKKYKQCCMNKEESSSARTKGPQKEKSQIDIPGLWTFDLFPEKAEYNSLDEFYDEIRATGRVPYILDEDEYDDDLIGHVHNIQIGQLCKHGWPCGEIVEFQEIDDVWEHIESGFSNVAACIICEILKDNVEIGCPNCGNRMPEYSEEEILSFYENSQLPLDLICNNCGTKFLQEKGEGFVASPPRNTEDNGN